MPEENIENITKSGSNFALTFVNHHVLRDVNFSGRCLINSNISIPEKVINLYISYILNSWLRNLNTDFTLNNCLFEHEKLPKNADLDKYKYSGYGIGFDSRSGCSFTDGSVGKNVIIFETDISSSVHIDDENKNILIFGEEPTHGSDDAILTANAKCPVNFTQPGKKFVLNLHYNRSNSFLFVKATKIYQFKAKGFEIRHYTLCLVNTSKGFTINNMKKKNRKKRKCKIYFW